MIPQKILLSRKVTEAAPPPAAEGSLYSWGSNSVGFLGLDSQYINKYYADIFNPEFIAAPSWTAISAGNSHAAAIKNGNLYVWGSSQFGQLGLNLSEVDPQSPSLVSSSVGGVSWAQIATPQFDNNFAVYFGLKSDGSLYAWGEELNPEYPVAAGLLGSTYFKSLSPVKIGSDSWNFVSTAYKMDGFNYDYQIVAAIKFDGALYAWGKNANGEIGDGTTIAKSTPTKIGNSSWTKVFLTSYETVSPLTVLGITSDNKLFEWGRSTHANALTTDYEPLPNRSSPVQVGAGIPAGFQSAFVEHRSNFPSWQTLVALGTDGHIYMSGGISNNYEDEVTYGRPVLTSSPYSPMYSSPVQVGTSSWNFVATCSTEAYHSVAIRSDGALFTWGENYYGTLGSGSTVPNLLSSPTQIGTSSWIKASITRDMTAAIRSDGTLFTWGNNELGQLADGTTIAKSSPIQIGSDTWSDISITNVYYGDYNGSFAIRSDGALFGWGGELFVGGPESSGVILSSPVQIGTDSWSSVSSGTEHVLAIKSDGTLWAWGYSYNGEIGNGEGDYVHKSSPVQIGTSSWSKVSAGAYFSSAIRSDGALFMWGANYSAQLGDETISDRSSPVQIGTDSWIQINAASYDNMRAIRSDGMLFAWGYNDDGSLGVGNPGDYISSPVMLGSDSWTMIGLRTTAGAPYYFNYMTHGIKADGRLYSIGPDTYGDAGLNLGSIIYNCIPLIPDFKLDNQIWNLVTGSGESDSRSKFAIRNDGALFAWGRNDNGELGDNTFDTRSSPVQIGTSSWIFINASYNRTIGILSDYSMFGWGNNYYSELINDGIVPNDYLSSPTQIGTYASWTQVFGGPPYYATSIDGSLYSWSSWNDITGFNWIVPSPTQLGSSNWIAVECGSGAAGINDGHTLGIRSDGALFTWGANDTGQLGDGTTIYKSSPVQIGTDSWTKISAGYIFNAAIRSDGALFTWGNNAQGQLGSSDLNDRSSPTQVASIKNYTNNLNYYRTAISAPVQIGNSNWSFIEAGYNFTSAIRSDGGLYTWGKNFYGELGDSSIISRSSPVQIGNDSWSIITMSNLHTAAIRSDGALFTWGANGYGELGDGTTIYKSSPVQIGSSSWLQVSVGGGVTDGAGLTVAIRSDGALFTWGRGDAIGNGLATLNSRSSPVQIGTSSWNQVSVGISGDHVSALRSDYILFSWGDNFFGQLGDSTRIAKSSPSQIGTSSWSKVDLGADMGAATRIDGKLFTWGYGFDGRLGHGNVISRSSPVQLAAASVIDSWSMISSAESHTAAIRSDGALFAWGQNNNGELGDGTTISKSSPVQIGTLSWSKVSAGGWMTAAIRADGTLFTWGNSGNGRLGGGAGISSRSSPVQIAVDSTWNDVRCSTDYTYTFVIAIKSNTELWAWGENYAGQLGDGTKTDKSEPTLIGGPSWASISAGTDHAAAIKTDGRLFTWGINSFGKLGLDDDGLSKSRSSPTQVGLSSWTHISTGDNHTAAITADGRLFTWGLDTSGCLGFGATRSSPVQVGTSSWNKVTAFHRHTVAIRNDGGLFAWGYNINGELGDETIVAKSSPIQIGTSSWTTLGVNGYATSSAIRYGNALFTWGQNGAGEVGDGTTTDRASPILLGVVTYGDSWNDFSCAEHMLAINAEGRLFAWGRNVSGQLGDGTTISKSAPVQISASSWVSVKAGGGQGEGHSIAKKVDNTIYTWGVDTRGQLGMYYSFLDSWTQISAGTQTLLAINSDGELYTMGYSEFGDSQIFYDATPRALNTTLNWQDISAGNKYHRGLTSDGKLYHWGTLYDWDLFPSGFYDYYYSPVSVVSGQSWVFASSSGYNETAINDKGELFTFGRAPLYGETARGTGGAGNHVTPEQPETKLAGPYNYFASDAINSWSMVSSGLFTTFGIRTDGLLYAWGRNNLGQLGDGTTKNRSYPTQIGENRYWAHSESSGNLDHYGILSDGALYSWTIGLPQRITDGVSYIFSSWSQLSAGESHQLIIRSDGALFARGYNSFGQLGDGTTTFLTVSPTQIGTSSWTYVSAGLNHSVAVRSDGALFTWGRNNAGQLGNGATINRSSPIQIGTSSWTKTSAGASHSAAIRSDGALFTWGANTIGEMGDGTAASKSSPVKIGNNSWSSVDLGNFHSTAIRSDGLLFTWGYNHVGQLGDGTTIWRSSPVQIGTSPWSYVSAGQIHSAAVRSDGALFVWGSGANGRIGDGTTVNKSSPVQIGSSSWIKVGAFLSHTSAITSDNRLFLWGTNYIAESVVATLVSSPVQLGSLNNNVNNIIYSWNLVSAGVSSVAAIRGDGTLWTWGPNDAGQLGDNTVNSRSSPIQIGSSYWSSVSVGSSYTLAIRSDGALFAWGNNFYGQLGDGTVNNKSSPVQIGTFSWSYVSAGLDVSAAIRSDGTLFTWGKNDYGLLGDGTTINNSSPVQIGTSSWIMVNAGQGYEASGFNFNVSYVAALRSDNKFFAWGRGLPDMTSVAKSSPVQIGTANWSYVGRSISIDSNGALFKTDHNSFSEDPRYPICLSNPYLATCSWNMLDSGGFYAIDEKSNLYKWERVYASVGGAGGLGYAFPTLIENGSWTNVDGQSDYYAPFGTHNALAIKI